jgi:hypothetical protein
MNAQVMDETVQPIQCLNAMLRAEQGFRQAHNATELQPVSIEGRWCIACQKTHYFQIRRAPSRRRLHVASKARDVLALFFVGELIAFALVVLAASAIAAVR